jgi:hypothetical protein
VPRYPFHLLYHFYSDFSVGSLEDVAVDLQGLGVLNWLGKKVILVEVEQNITNILMTTVKELLRKEFSKVTLMDLMFLSFKIL